MAPGTRDSPRRSGSRGSPAPPSWALRHAHAVLGRHEELDARRLGRRHDGLLHAHVVRRHGAHGHLAAGQRLLHGGLVVVRDLHERGAARLEGLQLRLALVAREDGHGHGLALLEQLVRDGAADATGSDDGELGVM
ncbi:hypothetical protein ON010_g17427 [Phytophthora cinnamomi]|nr:hypothetical protein ON010_g17427 [Phytophthora cinnamomi]